jgi:SDR family mycofactocin-dependent oxidoreductase
MSAPGGRLAGRVALVTGAAQGQGRAHALRFAAEGADLIVVDRGEQDPLVNYPMGTTAALEETAEQVRVLGRRAVGCRVDIRDHVALTAAVDAGVAELGRLDVVVANAAVCTVQEWNDVTPEVWELTLATNLTGTWHTCQASIPHLEAAGGGSIVLVSSAAGLSGPPLLLPYAVSKHGVVGLMRVLANELGPLSIRVNSVHPGGVDTPMGEGAHTAIGPLLENHPEYADVFAVALPDARMQAEDVTASVLFLASDESRFITGHTLIVDAGNTNR